MLRASFFFPWLFIYKKVEPREYTELIIIKNYGKKRLRIRPVKDNGGATWRRPRWPELVSRRSKRPAYGKSPLPSCAGREAMRRRRFLQQVGLMLCVSAWLLVGMLGKREKIKDTLSRMKFTNKMREQCGNWEF